MSAQRYWRHISILSLILLGLGAGCSRDIPPRTSFYFWRTELNLSHLEVQTLERNQAKLYCRYFDIRLSPEGKAIPGNPVGLSDSMSIASSLDIIPVVFIKNEVMLAEQTEPKALAEQTLRLIKQMSSRLASPPTEIQIDCDWSMKSKATFMAYMAAVREQWQGTISCTIRLHQVKYFEKTGIPPVDYGVLMYYNMGEINASEANSIYDKQIADLYTSTLSNYPLPLKVAFPIFGWGVHIRNNKVLELFARMNLSPLLAQGKLVKIRENRFQVSKSFLYGDRYFKLGDEVKWENIGREDLYEMAADVSAHSPSPIDEIIFYDLDDFNLNQYEETIFEEVARTF